MNKKKKWMKIVISLILLFAIGIGAGFGVNQYMSSSKTMTEKKFNKLEKIDFQVIDTSNFLDKKLEKWYNEKRKDKGVYQYQDKKDTYILVSLGKVKDNNTFLLLNGVKEKNGKIIIGYSELTMKNQNISFEDNIRSTLISVKGNHKNIKGIIVKESTSKKSS